MPQIWSRDTARQGCTNRHNQTDPLPGFPSGRLTSSNVATWVLSSSKTDQEGQGVTIAIARGDIACPVKALREWLDAAGTEAGPIFRPIDEAGTVRASRLTCRSVANIVKAHAGRAGFDARTFSGHSLRAGFLTSAAGKGASIFKMMDVSRHKSVDTLRGYVRDAELFKDHAQGQGCSKGAVRRRRGAWQGTASLPARSNCANRCFARATARVPGHFARAGPVLVHFARAGPVPLHFARAAPVVGHFSRAGPLPAHFARTGPLGAFAQAGHLPGHYARAGRAGAFARAEPVLG
jgi:hypothetical protein